MQCQPGKGCNMTLNLNRTTVKRVVALVLLVGAIGTVYAIATHSKLLAFANGQESSGNRKVLYWYDAMNPQHHYDKPGKAPDGMDLVPAYADRPNASLSQIAGPEDSGTMNTPGSSEQTRKVLYW